MKSKATIAALRQETKSLLAESCRGRPGDTSTVVDLITRCRLALSAVRDDGLGPWESPELEYAMHLASRHNLTQLALICAYEVLTIGDRSLGAMSDYGFLTFLA